MKHMTSTLFLTSLKQNSKDRKSEVVIIDTTVV